MKIEVVTFAQTGMEDFCEILFQSLEKNRSNDHEIIYKCFTPESNFKLNNFQMIYQDVGRNRNRNKRHTKMIQRVINDSVDDILMLIDCDTAVFYKGWDNLIVDKLKLCGMFGVDFGGHRKAFEKFPCQICIAMNKNIVESFKNTDIFASKIKTESLTDLSDVEDICEKDIDFHFFDSGSSKLRRLCIDNVILQKIYNKELGSFICCDTSWKLPLYAYKNNVKFDYMSDDKNGEFNAYLRKNFGRHIGFPEYKYNNKTFLVHFTKCSDQQKLLGDHYKKWIEASFKYLNQESEPNDIKT